MISGSLKRKWFPYQSLCGRIRRIHPELLLVFAQCECSVSLLRPYHCVIMGDVQQVHASLRIGKRADSQAVGRVELLHEEVTANLNDLRELQKARSSQ